MFYRSAAERKIASLELRIARLEALIRKKEAGFYFQVVPETFLLFTNAVEKVLKNLHFGRRYFVEMDAVTTVKIVEYPNKNTPELVVRMDLDTSKVQNIDYRLNRKSDKTTLPKKGIVSFYVHFEPKKSKEELYSDERYYEISYFITMPGAVKNIQDTYSLQLSDLEYSTKKLIEDIVHGMVSGFAGNTYDQLKGLNLQAITGTEMDDHNYWELTD